MSTPYHAKYYALDLLKQNSSDTVAKVGAGLFRACVDLNPHQLDAAVFAFRSPLSRGVILADEVGLGKTIEAGLVISQLWAERKRRILVICPTILRKQWAQELAEKFFLDSLVMESREYNGEKRRGNETPLRQADKIVICSYHFARSHEAEIRSEPWDLVVIDEAHRLRNVYRTDNRVAAAIRSAVRGRPMLLLTATPLQNSLLELYGLVSFIDEHVFGGLDTFRARYMRGGVHERELNELRQRLRPLCQRTLRRQVQEYVRFTNRIPITQDFTPTAGEQELYDRVSEYLQRPQLHALPNSQRMLTTMVLRKLLASSTYAIAGTLDTLTARLNGQYYDLTGQLADFDALSEVAEEWTDDASGTDEDAVIPRVDPSLQDELRDLSQFGTLAHEITVNAKGEALLQALAQGFAKMEELGAARKAVIFTESRRTQQYLYDLLAGAGYGGRVLTINGTNTDDRSGAIYKDWVQRHSGESIVTGNKTVDLRAALVEQFRYHADILIATEAAAEGVNLQFCSLVVNYDLPWNPQRIEQRIGRCHRYGQKHDVVVINFLNRSNAADQRVFELLSEKFRLFDGVFGSSDEVLGALESGVDFERRIAEIYQTCRSEDDIDSAFQQLQADLEEQITARMADTRVALLEHFDEEVRERLRLSREQGDTYLDRAQKALWAVARQEIGSHGVFHDDLFSFDLTVDSIPGGPLGRYSLSVTEVEKGHGVMLFRPGHPLAAHILSEASSRILEPAHIVFRYSQHGEKIGLLDNLIGCNGWLTLSKLTINSLEEEDRLLFAIVTDDGQPLHPTCVEKLFLVSGVDVGLCSVPSELDANLAETINVNRIQALAEIEERNGRMFDDELEKLERWADDLKYRLDIELKDLDIEIKSIKRDASRAVALRDKVTLQTRVKELETTRMRKRKELFEAHDEIDAKKSEIIEVTAARLTQRIRIDNVMTIKWSVE